MKAKCIFFTGLPCSGKSTLAKILLNHFPNSQLLDGDEIRDTPLADDVGFGAADRKKHILRMGNIAKMLVDNGVTVICSFVSPNREVRDEVRSMFNKDDFIRFAKEIKVPICNDYKPLEGTKRCEHYVTCDGGDRCGVCDIPTNFLCYYSLVYLNSNEIKEIINNEKT